MDGAFPSDPASFRGGGSAGFRGTAENAKTKLCNRWMQGDCRFGDRCNFAHGEQELRPLTGGGFDMGAITMEDLGEEGQAGAMGGGYGYGPQGGYGMDAGAGFQANPEVLQQEAYAQSGFPTHGPNGWIRYIAKDTGEPYFHNHKTGITQWERPQEWPM
eukprot:CAMPEP_0202366592 /NCGR_PEP_ID=MMETSP1126-20121109/17139_1 /ASSEMBLY_ACC=CAM_ASM_000457 /TAXON_ID=3047 /ORGANISM="Dunaliella tertiolecta, Strain CCMP1320" /LENGTH=158 /DNA_ID=CAMNT_0048961667 /DNA_START=5 /DNA_END=480 /DNA_ORIENTATION=+